MTYGALTHMLTKSLHTITAATNVAAYLIRRESQLSAATAELCAADAMHILGYGDDTHPRNDVWHSDPVLVRILANCHKAVAAESAKRAKGVQPERGRFPEHSAAIAKAAQS